MYDVAIIGTGPAGLSVAINMKLHKKDYVWFGAPELSNKVEKSEKIANYPGLSMISGKKLNEEFRKQIEEMNLTITNKMVTSIMKMKDSYVVLADNEVFEAKTILLAIGAVISKSIPGEEEYVGRGISYCATCDGFLQKGKTIGVYCGAKRFEHEVEYLAQIAEKVYLYTPYKDCGVNLPNVEKLALPIAKIKGQAKISAVELSDGSKVQLDTLFIIRDAIDPSKLLAGLQLDGPHIVVDRHGCTNIEGCYAAGDCTGRPYQLTKAIGEGNVAAHSILEYIAEIK